MNKLTNKIDITSHKPMSSNPMNGHAPDPESISSPFLLSHQRSLSQSTSQVALVGANVSPIESLDYEIAENDVFKQDWRSRGKKQMFQYLYMKWSLCFLVGLIVSLIGFFNNLAVENIAGMKFVVTSNMMLAQRFVFLFVISLLLTLFASVITAFIAPAAAGSGIPEIKAYLNGVDAPGILSARTLFVKIVGSISAVSASLLVGKAGPMVHTGACVASLLTQGGSNKYGLTWRGFRFFKNDRDRRDLITCGSAAGITAAFRAPVGGVLFALEEMASWWRSALLWRSFFVTAVVAIILRALIDFCLSGQCGLFGKGGLIVFDVYSANITYHLVDVPFVLLLGVIGGILGSLYNSILEKVLRIYNFIHEKGMVYKILLACLISIFTSCLLFGVPWLGSCQPCPAGALEACPTIGRSGNYKKFQCPSGHYNDLASLIFNTNDDAIKNLFSRNTDAEFQHSSVLLFFIICYFLSILSYGIVLPAGLFVPVIVTGASYGRFVGMLVGSHSTLNHGLYAVLGAASFLGGSMRMTVSLCVILLELTNNLLLLPLTMLVLLISKTVADTFNGNIYDLIMKAKGLPYLEAHAEPYMRQLTVGDVVTGPLRIFHGIEKVGNIVHVLRITRHNGFPVIDEPPQSESKVLYGLILRSHLIELLKKKEGFMSTPAVRDASEVLARFSAADFAKRGSGNGESIDDMDITEEEMEMYLDLHPFTNASPYTVVETMSLAKALLLFRQVGLRHLLVIPKITNRSPVVGILTRHDFMPEHILGLHPLLLRGRWKRLRLQLPRTFSIF
ncbi:Putative chloride channel-like protein CLC-g [Linum perenne]